MNVNDPSERRRLTILGAFKLPGHENGTHSHEVEFTISRDPVRIDDGRKKRNYTPREQRRRDMRKSRRERERLAEERATLAKMDSSRRKAA